MAPPRGPLSKSIPLLSKPAEYWVQHPSCQGHFWGDSPLHSAGLRPRVLLPLVSQPSQWHLTE